MNETHICRSLLATRRLAKHFAGILRKAENAIILFEDADMGAGKTTFTSSVVAALDPKAKPVTSPTFTIINQYAENIFHIDLYRIENEQELANTDFDDIIAGNNFVFIEWSNKTKRNFSGRVFRISIKPLDNYTRKFVIRETQDEKV